MMPVVADLFFVEIAEGIAHGTGGIRRKIAFGWIEKPGCTGKGFLSDHFDFRMGQAGDIFKIPRDLCRYGKEIVHQCAHGGNPAHSNFKLQILNSKEEEEDDNRGLWNFPGGG